MSDLLVSALSAVFVVMQSTGQYSDRNSTPVKSFATREAADRFMASKEATVRRLEGVQDAINAIHAEWQKANPAPEESRGGGYIDLGAAYEAWHTMNAAEIERLETITGFKASMKEAGFEYDDVSYIGYYINEVPFQS